METKKFKVNDLKEFPGNYNKHPDIQIEHMKRSLIDFGQTKNIVVWRMGQVVCGNGLVMSLRQLVNDITTRSKWFEALTNDQKEKAVKRFENNEFDPIIGKDVSHLTQKQAKALLIADNKTAQMGIEDESLLKDLLSDFDDFLEIPGITEEFLKKSKRLSDEYTKKIKPVIYEPTGETPQISELFCNIKEKELIKEIEQSDISEDIKDFLKYAAKRHVVFNYKKIANFYANSNPTVQDLMERSALVIIDFNQSLEYGYTILEKSIEEQLMEEYPDEQ